jgi:regulator of RNase E activity RraA
MKVFKKVGTGAVADALAMARLEGSIPDIRPARGFEDGRIVGPAVTVYWAPARPGTPEHTHFNAIHAAAPGSVLVIDGKGMHQRFGGDRHAEYAKRHGVAAFVIWGGVRDIAGFREIGMPLYSLGGSTKAKPGNFRVAAINIPVEVGGVVVNPGDIIVADEDGVVAVPKEAVSVVMENLKVVLRVEEEVNKAIERGAAPEEINTIATSKKPK